MGSMDMGGMSMSMGSSGLFTDTNKKIARGYWYMIAGVVALLTLVRVINALEARRRLRVQEAVPRSIPSRPQSSIAQAYATATATLRELSYPQPLYFTGRYSRYFSPLPIGRWLVLAVYWTVVLTLLWSNTIMRSEDPMYAYKWEKVGFRAAWVSVTQIPFVYLLSSKFNPISLLTGISYERFNWLHRWAARTVFLTIIVHWSFFIREWWLADFVSLEIKMMPMVKYGFGAFGVITWMLLSGFGFFRAAQYELFVLQHIAAAIVLLWLLIAHVPSYAQYNVYLAIAFMAFDWAARIVWNISRNTHLTSGLKLQAPGYEVTLRQMPGDVVRVSIDNADFSWKAGQHVFLTIPRLRPFELHPFTIASSCTPGGSSNHLELLIKAHSGFSRSLHKAALQHDAEERSYKAFLSGPWGMPPDLKHYDTVVLIASSTGATFTTPLLEQLVANPGCARAISLHWIIRSKEHFGWFGDTLQALVRNVQGFGISLQVTVHVTQSTDLSRQSSTHDDLKTTAGETTINTRSRSEASSLTSEGCWGTNSISSAKDETSRLTGDAHGPRLMSALTVCHGSRPSVESMIRGPVEAAFGETAIVVCGGTSITAQSRTYVAALSDERAVHKGTGAQGIYLFTETYGWS